MNRVLLVTGNKCLYKKPETERIEQRFFYFIRVPLCLFFGSYGQMMMNWRIWFAWQSQIMALRRIWQKTITLAPSNEVERSLLPATWQSISASGTNPVDQKDVKIQASWVLSWLIFIPLNYPLMCCEPFRSIYTSNRRQPPSLMPRSAIRRQFILTHN